MTCLNTTEMTLYMENCFSAKEKSRFEDHISSCSNCKDTLAEMTLLTTRLAPSKEEDFDSPEFAKNVMTLVNLGQANSEKLASAKPTKGWVWKASAVMAAAATISAFVVFSALNAPNIIQPEDDGFQARGGVAPDDAQWTSLGVFKKQQNDFLAVKEAISATDALAFTYQNLKNDQLKYLMVFAVDPSGNVFWYYPAYEKLGENPKAIEIAKSKNTVQLSEAVRHTLSPGQLLVFGLFSKERLAVEQVERRIQNELKHGASFMDLTLKNWQDCVAHRHLFRVDE